MGDPFELEDQASAREAVLQPTPKPLCSCPGCRKIGELECSYPVRGGTAVCGRRLCPAHGAKERCGPHSRLSK